MSFRHVRNVRGFFSDYYLGSVFHRGDGRGRKKKLSDRDTDIAYRRFQRLHAQAEDRAPDAAACRERFLRPFLRDVLGFHLGAGEERVHGLFTTAEDEERGGRPIAVAYLGAWDEDLDLARGSAAPRARLEAAIDAAGVPYGFLATGERLRIVRAAGEGARASYLEIDLDGLVEEDDPESFAAFFHLAHERNFVLDSTGDLPIRRVEKESRQQAERVSEDLKRAVFGATEMLVQSLLADAARRGLIAPQSDLSESEIGAFRDAGLTAIYRLLFILYAEARDPRLRVHKIYHSSYSLEGLVEDLIADPTRDHPANRTALWSRLRALFEIYDRGLERISGWEHIPPRGGHFFDAETGSGRLLDEARLGDRDVVQLVLALTTTTPRRGIGFERVSFRELDIEQLGSVYEGLLEFEPRVARELLLEVKVAGKAMALTPPALVRLCSEKKLVVRGDIEIVEGTEAESLHPDSAEDEDDDDLSEDEAEPEETDAEDDADGVARGAAVRLVRRMEAGSFHFVPGVARKGSGSFYTPNLLVQDLVVHALGPVVEGKTATEIERLRVLDPACGSAHFLVEAMRYLGRALHKAYVEENAGKPPTEFRDTIGQGWDSAWEASDADARLSNSEARAWCKRRIAERCLFGVDLNPTAVELARVALWIESLAGDRPLTYFAHHVRCGNSLLGSWLTRLDYPPLPTLAKKDLVPQPGLFSGLVRNRVKEAARFRRMIDETTPDVLRQEGLQPESVEEFRFKERQHEQAEETLGSARLLFDLRSSSAFVPAIWKEWGTLYSFVDDRAKLESFASTQAWSCEFDRVRARERFFHWELEFPEVFLGERKGFDAVLGNPPWDKVIPSKHEFFARADALIRAYKGNELDRRITELVRERPALREEFDAYTERTTTVAKVLRQGGDFPLSEARSQAAHEDVSKYFVDRAARLAAEGGRVGFVVPSVLYNGDGCVGIRRFLLNEARIERFYGFENHKKRFFPIDSRYKFVNLVFRKGDAGDGAFDAAFMRRDLAELVDGGQKPWLVRLTRDEVSLSSPETLALLEFRGPRDQAILRRMQSGRPSLGADGPDSWGTTLVSDFGHFHIYNISRDKDLFTDPATGKLYTPETVLDSPTSDANDNCAAMRAKGFWPVFEGKHVDQFCVGAAPVRWWMCIDRAKSKHGKAPRTSATLVFRQVARNTDERTCIAAVLPERSAGANTLTGMLTENIDADASSAVLNSLPFDYALRMRTAGTHVAFTYILPVPVPPAAVVNSLPRIPTQLAWRTNIEHISDDQTLWRTLWSSNRAVAEAYNLTPDDFAHILASFPGFAKKRPAFHAYFLARLAEWHAELAVRGVDYPEVAENCARAAETPN